MSPEGSDYCVRCHSLLASQVPHKIAPSTPYGSSRAEASQDETQPSEYIEEPGAPPAPFAVEPTGEGEYSEDEEESEFADDAVVSDGEGEYSEGDADEDYYAEEDSEEEFVLDEIQGLIVRPRNKQKLVAMAVFFFVALIGIGIASTVASLRVVNESKRGAPPAPQATPASVETSPTATAPTTAPDARTAGPAIVSVTPSEGRQNTQATVLFLGTGLSTVYEVLLWDGQAAVPCVERLVTHDTSITCTFNLRGVPVGTYQIVVKDPNGEYTTPFDVYAIDDQ